jgi:3-methylcrotonyl-CoA carboxylase alpha subunit
MAGMTRIDPAAVRAVVAGSDRRPADPVIVVASPREPAALPRLTMIDDGHAILEEVDPTGRLIRVRAVLGEVTRQANGRFRREVVVGGWRVEVEIEPAARAELRERATRSREGGVIDGPDEIRAIIPGRIVAVSVAAGDTVTAGQQVLVLEAMKMQNELRSPRDGAVERLGVGVGDKVEVGDILLVLR